LFVFLGFVEVVLLLRKLLFAFVLVLFCGSVFAATDVVVSGASNISTNISDHVDMYLFYSNGCPHCANMKIFLDSLKVKYPLLVVNEYELQKNIDLFFEFAAKYDMVVGDSVNVPVIFVHERVFVGDSVDVENDLEAYVGQCVGQCVNPSGSVNSTKTFGSSDSVSKASAALQSLTLPALVSAAFVDSINPCAFAVLIILLSTILVAHNKRKALLSGFAFSLAVFLSYFLMGVGLYSALQFSGLTRLFYIFSAVLAVLVGLFNLKDYFWYGKWFIMEVPLSWRPAMKGLIKSVTSIPGAFFVGILVSLFLLPCTSGPYIVILGLLSHSATHANALLLLLLYNSIFVLPMLIITLLVYFGLLTTERAEQWRLRKVKILHLIAGVVMLLIGFVMIAGLILGWL
jgi:cytochrome c biogenesis protein CcdA/glutaredoxin